MGFWLVFIGLGGGGLEAFFARGIRPSKRLPEGFARGDGQAWN